MTVGGELRSPRGAGTAACRADAPVSAGERNSPRPRGARRRPQESGRGTHECARHAAVIRQFRRPQPAAPLKPALLPSQPQAQFLQ